VHGRDHLGHEQRAAVRARRDGCRDVCCDRRVLGQLNGEQERSGLRERRERHPERLDALGRGEGSGV
jgi:hypothetical protein